MKINNNQQRTKGQNFIWKLDLIVLWEKTIIQRIHHINQPKTVTIKSFFSLIRLLDVTELYLSSQKRKNK